MATADTVVSATAAAAAAFPSSTAAAKSCGDRACSQRGGAPRRFGGRCNAARSSRRQPLPA